MCLRIDHFRSLVLRFWRAAIRVTARANTSVLVYFILQASKYLYRQNNGPGRDNCSDILPNFQRRIDIALHFTAESRRQYTPFHLRLLLSSQEICQSKGYFRHHWYHSSNSPARLLLIYYNLMINVAARLICKLWWLMLYISSICNACQVSRSSLWLLYLAFPKFRSL